MIRELKIYTLAVTPTETSWEIPQGTAYLDIAIRPQDNEDVFVRLATEEEETQDGGKYRSIYPETANWTPWNFKVSPNTVLFFKSNFSVTLEIIVGIE